MFQIGVLLKYHAAMVPFHVIPCLFIRLLHILSHIPHNMFFCLFGAASSKPSDSDQPCILQYSICFGENVLVALLRSGPDGATCKSRELVRATDGMDI